MCQSRSHGHHHQHRSQHDRSNASAHHHHGAAEPSRLTRRQALRQLTAAGLAAAASGPPWGPLVRAVEGDGQAAAAGPAVPKLFDLKQVAPGIYGAIAKPTAMLNCNAAVIVNRDHVLVVDTHSKPSAAKALIRQIRDEVTELPVRYVVDSHLHGDHAMGNEAYPEVFGANVEVISSVKTREWLEKLGVPRMQETLDFLPKQIAEFRARLEASKDESERAALVAQIEGIEAYLKEMRPARVTLPTITFDHRLVIHRGGREIHLLFLGRGAHGRRRRRLHPLRARDRDRRPDARPAPLHGGRLPRRVARHSAGTRGPGVRPRHSGTRVDPGGEVGAGRVPRVHRGDHREGRPRCRARAIVGRAQEDDHRRDSHVAQGRRRAPRIERELTTLFPRPVRPPNMFDESIASNVGEVFVYFKERKGRRELPLK